MLKSMYIIKTTKKHRMAGLYIAYNPNLSYFKYCLTYTVFQAVTANFFNIVIVYIYIWINCSYLRDIEIKKI